MEGRYIVQILDHDGTPRTLVEGYEYLEYTRAINGKGHHGWGSFHLHGAREELPVGELTLDRLLSVQRLPPDGLWRVDFEGLQRRRQDYLSGDDDVLRTVCEGFDLRSLVKRRVIAVPDGQAALQLSGHFTDVCRELVDLQAGPAAGDRALPYFAVQAPQGDGPAAPEALNFRYVNLAEELETYAGGVGFDFDVVRAGSSYLFRIDYPMQGVDRRVGNPDGRPAQVFSVGLGNVKTITVTWDRSREVTAAYVLGDGFGATRERLWRYSLIDAQYDSPWNRVEVLVESSQDSHTADLMAQGDAAVTHFQSYVAFELEALPVPGSLYGADWDLGDLVTVRWDDTNYPGRVVQVRVVVDGTGEHIQPQIVYWPEEIAPDEE